MGGRADALPQRQVFRDSPDTIKQANHSRLDHSGSTHHKFVEMACHGCENRLDNPTAARNDRRGAEVLLSQFAASRQSQPKSRDCMQPVRDFCCRFAADAAVGKIGCNTRLCCVLEPVTASASPSGSVAYI
jgi:hypothetical protein